MMRTLRAWLARTLSTEIGVLGARLDEHAAVIAEMSEDYSAFKERVDRQLKKQGMRWARSGGNGVDMSDPAVLEALLKRSRPSYDPFSEM